MVEKWLAIDGLMDRSIESLRPEGRLFEKVPASRCVASLDNTLNYLSSSRFIQVYK